MRRVRGFGTVVALALLPGAFPAHAAGVPTPLVQPGRAMRSATGACTIGFLFRDSRGRQYGTSAGHCAPVPARGEGVWARGRGPVITSGGRAIGRFVYARLTPADSRDLSVFEVLPGIASSPAVCFWGGPTALLTTSVGSPIALEHYGHGEQISLVARERVAAASDIPRQPYVHALGAVLFGDSGSAIQTSDGRAVGVITDIELGQAVGTIAINRLDIQLPRIAALLHTTLVLRTAPLKTRPEDDCA